jgi:hypothetical protein
LDKEKLPFERPEDKLHARRARNLAPKQLNSLANKFKATFSQIKSVEMA